MRILKKVAALFAAVVVACLLALVVAGARYHPAEAIAPGFVGTQRQIGDRQLRVLELGSGSPILFVHGSPGSVEDWAPMMMKLAQHHRVVAYDRPGNGFSDGVGVEATLADNAKTLRGVIQGLELHGVVVVGHSYGGATALALAVDSPGDVKAFVIVESRSYPPSSPDLLFRILAIPYLGEGLARAITGFVGPSKMKAGIDRSFAPNEDQIPAGFLEARMKLWSSPKVVTTLARESVRYEQGLKEISPRYGSIKGKVFIVQGDVGPRAEMARRLHETIAGSELTVLKNTGHYAQFIRPAEVEAVIEQAAAMPAE